MFLRVAFVLLTCAAAVSGPTGYAAAPDPALRPTVGQTFIPPDAGDTITAAAAPEGSAPTLAAPDATSTPECHELREYTTISLGGEPQQARGVACLQADGTSRINETAVGGSRQYTNSIAYY